MRRSRASALAERNARFNRPTSNHASDAFRAFSSSTPYCEITVGASVLGSVLRLRKHRTMPSIVTMPTPAMTPSAMSIEKILSRAELRDVHEDENDDRFDFLAGNDRPDFIAPTAPVPTRHRLDLMVVLAIAVAQRLHCHIKNREETTRQ